MRSIPLVRQAALAPAVSYLAAEGVPVRRYLRRARLSVPSPETLETLIPLHQLCDFLSSVARAEGINDLGFRIGGHRGRESLGVFGRLVEQSLTIHESIQTTIELISSYNSGLRIWAERHNGQVGHCQKYVENLPQDRMIEVVHLGLTNLMGLARHALGPDWRPNRIELASGPIDLTAHFSGLGDLPVSFNRPRTSVWVDEKVLSAPLPRYEAGDFSPAHEDGRATFLKSAPATNPMAQLEQAIEAVLGHPSMNLRFTAAIIGTSARTLQRRLAERGSSFSRLLQGVRFRNAQRLLQDPQMPLTEIARRLGYTDPANFIRAFKRWTGVGPSEFRRLQYEGGHK
jgi:AraC-like DNA-binding protein